MEPARSTEGFSKRITVSAGNNIVTVLDLNQANSEYQIFAEDYIVKFQVALEDIKATVGLFSLSPAPFPEINALMSEASQQAEIAKVQTNGQKIALGLYCAKGNGPWEYKSRVVLQNQSGDENHVPIMVPFLSTNETLLVGGDFKFGVKIEPVWNQPLKANDYIIIMGTYKQVVSFTSKKKDDTDALKARIESIELALYGRLTNLPANSLLGRGNTIGTAEIIPQNTFAKPTDIDAAILNLIGAAPAALNTLDELAQALSDDQNFATSVTNSLAGKVSTAGNENISGAKTFTSTIRAGVSTSGNIALQAGNTSASGYLELFKGSSSATRLGFIGFSDTDINYTAENGATHRFNGGRADFSGGSIPGTNGSRLSLFLSGNSPYFSLISASAALNYKAYDFCNENGAFSVRRINDGYTGVAGNILRYTPDNTLTLGDNATKSNAVYGSFSASGVANGYAGIHFPEGYLNPVFMISSTSGLYGIWSPTGAVNGWSSYCNEGDFRIFNFAAQTEGSFIGLAKGLGSLPGYSASRYPTIKTDFTVLYFSVGGVYSASMNQNGVLTAISDRNRKENLRKCDDLEILELLKNIPIYTYNFKDSSTRIRNMGCMAQDFYEAFGLGGDTEIDNDDSPASPSKMLAPTDAIGVCMAAIKGVAQEIEKLKSITATT
jgi:Chaperone of endosialidase